MNTNYHFLLEHTLKFRIQLLFILFCYLQIQAKGNEFGIAVGINSSFYKTWYENRTEYQKCNMLNPIEVYYKKDLLSFLSLFSAVQYNKKTISEVFDRTNENGDVFGKFYFEKSMNFISVQVSPLIFYKINRFAFDIMVGLSGEIYINQFENFGGLKDIYRNTQMNPFMLSLLSGVGIRYAINEKVFLGLSTRLSRTLTDIYKNQTAKNMYFVNWQNIIYIGFGF